MDWHAIKTLELGMTFAGLAKPPMSDEAYYELLDPEPVWIEQVARKLFRTLKGLRATGKPVDAEPTFSVSLQEPTAN